LDGSACDTLGLNNIPVAHFRMDDSLNVYSRFFYDLSHHEPATWQWGFGDGQSSSAQNPLHTYDSAGVYNVCLTVSNAYGSDTQCRTLYVGVSATDSPEHPLQWLLYPNPADGFVTLEYAGNSPVKGPLLLFNALGQLIKTVPLPHQTSFQHRISLAGLPEGVYGYVVAGTPGLAGKLVVGR
jgi:PKD repeat protein